MDEQIEGLCKEHNNPQAALPGSVSYSGLQRRDNESNILLVLKSSLTKCVFITSICSLAAIQFSIINLFFLSVAFGSRALVKYDLKQR